MWRRSGNSGNTSYSGMMAPPGKPKMVETPSSTSDWHIARAPFKRIWVLTSVERTIALSVHVFRREQKTPPPTEARSNPAVPPCLCLLAVLSSATPARPTTSRMRVLPHGSEASSGTCSRRSCTNRRLSVAERQFRTAPRQCLTVCSCCAEPYTVGSISLKYEFRLSRAGYR